MSYIFSRVLVEAYLAANCSESAPSAPSNSNPIPQAYCSPGKMTAFSRLSRFGMTYAPLTDDHGAVLLTWYLEAFLARTSAFPEREKDWKGREADCGQKWRESFAKFDRDSSSWKIPQTLPGWDLTVSSETWPKWGTMRNGVCWPAPATSSFGGAASAFAARMVRRTETSPTRRVALWHGIMQKLLCYILFKIVVMGKLLYFN